MASPKSCVGRRLFGPYGLPLVTHVLRRPPRNYNNENNFIITVSVGERDMPGGQCRWCRYGMVSVVTVVAVRNRLLRRRMVVVAVAGACVLGCAPLQAVGGGGGLLRGAYIIRFTPGDARGGPSNAHSPSSSSSSSSVCRSIAVRAHALYSPRRPRATRTRQK